MNTPSAQVSTSLAVAVFARAPVAGHAKTRLIPLLGAEGAARLQQQLIVRALQKACALAQARITLWVAGDVAHPFMVEQAQRFGVNIAAQSGADLGARMHAAFMQSLQTHARCVLIGTDCPALTTDHLEQAAALLRDHDAVLQPALDGGYVLLGLNRARADRPHAELFSNIAWGTDTVLATTQQRLAMLELRTATLPSLPDLDTPDDYRHAIQHALIVSD